jgi:hypothetical protein
MRLLPIGNMLTTKEIGPASLRNTIVPEVHLKILHHDSQKDETIHS